MLVEPTAQKQAPSTAIDAKFSLPFCIGAALATGAITLPTFFAEGRQHAETLAIAKRVRFTPDQSLGMKDAASGSLRIRLHDGRELSHSIAQASGSPANPLDDKALIAKFADCARYARPVMSDTKAMSLARALLNAASAPSAANLFGAING